MFSGCSGLLLCGLLVSGVVGVGGVVGAGDDVGGEGGVGVGLGACPPGGAVGVGESHCHVFLGGLDPGQAPLKAFLLMLRLT